jgi:hypothetical protein
MTTKTRTHANEIRSGMGVSSKRSIESIWAAILVALISFFIIDFKGMMRTGRWIRHGGKHAFKDWPIPMEDFLVTAVHAGGMLIWLAIVVHQLLTKGAGWHKVVGYIGAPLMLLSLSLAYRPAADTLIPTTHGVLGLTLENTTLIVDVVGIAVETIVGILKARSKHLTEHRQHMICAALFTAGPGLYRLLSTSVSNSSNALRLQVVYRIPMTVCG